MQSFGGVRFLVAPFSAATPRDRGDRRSAPPATTPREHPGQPGKWPLCQLTQLHMEARRQVDADLADMLVHEVVIVGQPLGGGSCVVAVPGRSRHGAVGPEQKRGIVCEAGGQPTSSATARCHRLGCG